MSDGISKNDQTMLRVGTIWFPLGMVMSLAGFLIWFSWTASQERSEINNRIDNVSSTVRSLSDTVTRLVNSMGQPDTDRVTRREWLIECLQLQIANPGFICPYGANQPRPYSEQRGGGSGWAPSYARVQ